jgi:hypothetical protein
MAKEILTQARLKELFSYDEKTGFFVRHKRLGPKKDIAGHVATKGHRQIMVDRKLYMAHRLAWLYVYGEHPKLLLDHINRNPDDNRICNLRLATNSQNQQNTRIKKSNKSGVKGVGYCLDSRSWRARITKNDKTFDLGRFKNFDLAVEARKKAEDSMFTHHKG